MGGPGGGRGANREGELGFRVLKLFQSCLWRGSPISVHKPLNFVHFKWVNCRACVQGLQKAAFYKRGCLNPKGVFLEAGSGERRIQWQDHIFTLQPAPSPCALKGCPGLTLPSSKAARHVEAG